MNVWIPPGWQAGRRASWQAGRSCRWNSKHPENHEKHEGGGFTQKILAFFLFFLILKHTKIGNWSGLISGGDGGDGANILVRQELQAGWLYCHLVL